MSRKIIGAAVVVLLVGLACPVIAADPDPDLEGWWMFDGDALDSSGNDRHGTLVGDAQLVDTGILGGALSLDGDGDYVTIDGYKGINADRSDPDNPFQQPFSVTCWISLRSAEGSLVNWGSSDGTGVGGQYQNFRINGGRLRAEHGNGRFRGATMVDDGEWHHVAMSVAEGANLDLPGTQLYVDGAKDPQGADTVNQQNIWNLTEDANVAIGARASHVDRFLDGMFDDVRIYGKALTQSDVRIIAGLFSPYAPDPADGALIEATSAMLQWTPGPTAVESDLYFGTTPELGPDQLIGRMAETSYMAADLVDDQMYYWRVDAVEADGVTIHPGAVWSFWIAPRRAYDPQPADGFINMATNTQLSWTGGWSPLMHAVYFGTDKDTVASAAGGMPQMETTSDPGALETDTTYYWRVDEFYNGQWVAGPVWSFTTVPDIPAAEDPNLMVSWTFEEQEGRTALDMAGRGHHGTFMGTPERTEGYSGSALLFGPNSERDYVVRSLPQAESLSAFTVTFWAKAGVLGQAQYSSPFTSHTPNTAGFQIDVDGTVPGLYRVNPPGWTSLAFGPVTTEWVHLTLTSEDTVATTYYNGMPAMVGTLNATDTTFNEFAVGINRNGDNFFEGIIDEVQVYDKALTADEIQGIIGDALPTLPIIAVGPAASVETTGDDGMVLSINGTAVETLVLGTTTTDFEKHVDHPAPHADDFDLGTYASLDDSSFITTMFAAPVSTVFIIERGGNDLGFIQPLDAAGEPVGGVQSFAKSDWFMPGIKISGQDGGAIVIRSAVPISGIMVLPPADANMGLDPASVSAIAVE